MSAKRQTLNLSSRNPIFVMAPFQEEEKDSTGSLMRLCPKQRSQVLGEMSLRLARQSEELLKLSSSIRSARALLLQQLRDSFHRRLADGNPADR